jgi:hypothetical protein
MKLKIPGKGAHSYPPYSDKINFFYVVDINHVNGEWSVVSVADG